MRKLFRSVVLLVLLGASQAFAQAANLLPNGKQTFVDGNGQPYTGGSVYFYIPSTTTPKTTWVDPAEATPNANPVVLDSAGRAIIYGQGQYREVLKDQYGNTIWDQLTSDGQLTFTAPTVQKFTSGSGTYTTPAGVKWIEVQVVGGGGAGGATAGTGASGTASTFGTSLLTANGGAGGPGQGLGNSGGVGGTASGGNILNVTGGDGTSGGASIVSTIQASGGIGGSSCLGGAGSSTFSGSGLAAAPNSGGGGGGGGVDASNTSQASSGGGAGGCVESIIAAPNATYPYVVGPGGAGSTGGGAGGSGFIDVIEHYN